NYLSNLSSEAPCLWVVLRQREAEPPYQVVAVTADPAEGEAYSEAGNDLIDTVPMPPAIAAVIEAFIAEHHIERPFFKRERDRSHPAAGGGQKGGGGRQSCPNRRISWNAGRASNAGSWRGNGRPTLRRRRQPRTGAPRPHRQPETTPTAPARPLPAMPACGHRAGRRPRGAGPPPCRPSPRASPAPRTQASSAAP